MRINKIVFRGLIILLIFINVGFVNVICAQEKVLLTTDRDYYISGEDLWFTVGIYHLDSQEYSDLSKVVYLELLNDKNIPILQVKANTNNENTQSRISIPDSLSTGAYKIRAYTRWMKNKDVSLFARKNITIINPFDQSLISKNSNPLGKDTIYSFPESGHLYPDVENKILIYACDKFGKELEVEGKIIDDLGNIVKEFITNKDGKGLLKFVPKENTSYSYLYEGNSILMPNVSEEKYYLKLLKEGIDNYTFKIFGDHKALQSFDIITQDGRVLHRYSISKNGIVKVSLTALQSQKLYALLLNERKQIVMSRAFYPKGMSSTSTINIKNDKKLYGRREKVNLKIDALNTLSDITVSVVKECLLKEHVNKFKNNDDLLADNSPNYTLQYEGLLLPEMEGELITGLITDSKTRKPISGKKFALNFVTQSPILKFSTTDSLGHFKYFVNRYGDEEMVIQPFSPDATLLDYKVTLSDVFSNKFEDFPQIPFFLDSVLAKGINEAIINTQINAVYYPYIKNVIMADSVEKSEVFYSIPEFSTIVDRYIELPTIEELVREVVPYTGVRSMDGQYYFKIKESYSSNILRSKTLTFLDGVLLKDFNELLKLSPQILEKIDVVNLKFYIQNEELGYLLCFYTKNSDMADIEFDQRIFRQVHRGYIDTYSFKVPKYSTHSDKISRIPDFRNTLYFDSVESLDTSSPINVSFFTSDEETVYSILVRGVNEYGQIEEARKNFTVSENKQIFDK